MKLLPEFPGDDGSQQELTGVDSEGSGQELAGKGPDRRYPETVLEPLGSNTWTLLSGDGSPLPTATATPTLPTNSSRQTFPNESKTSTNLP